MMKDKRAGGDADLASGDDDPCGDGAEGRAAWDCAGALLWIVPGPFFVCSTFIIAN